MNTRTHRTKYTMLKCHGRIPENDGPSNPAPRTIWGAGRRRAGAGAGGRARDAGGRHAGEGAGGRARDAGGRRAGAGAGDRVRVSAGIGPTVETLGSLTASEEEDSAQTMTPVRFPPIYTRYHL